MINNKQSIDNLIIDNQLFIKVDNFRDNYKELSSKGCVYIFVFKEKINRLKGSSKILKIGQTKNLNARMKRYFNVPNIKDIEHKPKRQTAYRLRKFVDSRKEQEVSLFIKEYDNASTEELKNKEKRLLNLYLKEHFETPPLNMGMS